MQEQPQPDIAMTIITAASEGLSDRLAKTEEGQKVLDVVHRTLTEREVDPATTDKIVKMIASDPVFITETHKEIDKDATTRQEIFGKALQASAFDLKDTMRRMDEHLQLAQFLGVSLRAVLPYAQTEYESIGDVARRDNDEVARAEARVAGRAVTRANHALKELEASELNINDLEDDSLDEDFQVVFEDEDVDPTDD
mgnify:CR=1 FL=1